MSQDTRRPSSVYKPITSPRTYMCLLYLATAALLGTLYAAMLSMGLLTGILLSIIGVGLVVLAVTLYVARGLTGFERWTANVLLGTDIEPYDDIDAEGGGIGRLRAPVEAASTWRGLTFLLAKFWVALLGFMVLWAFSRAVLLIPSVALVPYEVSFGEVNGEPTTWTVETMSEAVVASGVGVVLLVFLLYLTHVLGYALAKKSEALLGR